MEHSLFHIHNQVVEEQPAPILIRLRLTHHDFLDDAVEQSRKRCEQVAWNALRDGMAAARSPDPAPPFDPIMYSMVFGLDDLELLEMSEKVPEPEEEAHEEAAPWFVGEERAHSYGLSDHTKRLKLFVAGPSDDMQTVFAVMDAISELGHEVYDWTNGRGWSTPERAVLERDAILDLAHVAESDGVIWLDSYCYSEGAPLEIGFALGRNIPVVGLSNGQTEEGERFYRHLFPEAPTVDQAIETIVAMRALK